MENSETVICKKIHQYVEFWDNQEGKTQKEKLNGLAFSLLKIFDGTDLFLSDPVITKNHKMLHNMYMKTYLKNFDT